MKTLIGITFLMLTTSQIVAQDTLSPRDSLLNFINSYEYRDTVRVEALIDVQEFFIVDDHNQGLPYIREAIQISDELDYAAGLGSSLNALGGYYTQQGELDSALVNTLRAIDILESINSGDRIIAAYNNLAIIYGQTNELDKAVESYLEIVTILKEQELSNSHVVVYYNLAIAYQLSGNNDDYEFWIRKVIETSNEIGFDFGTIRGSLGLAAHLFTKNDFEQVIRIADEVLLKITEVGNVQQAQARAHSLKASAYEQLGLYDQAVQSKLLSIRIFEEVNASQSLMYAYEELGSIYRKKNDLKNALDNYLIAQEIKDSLFTAEQQGLVEELKTKYETERIEREKDVAELENLRLVNENQRSQLMFFGSVGILLLMTISGIAFYRDQQFKKKVEIQELKLEASIKQLEVEKGKQIAELKAVNAQLNPHFLFNLMNTVKEMHESGDLEKADRAIDSISLILRKILTHSEKERITLRDELELIKLYLEAEKLRFGNRLTYSIQVDESVESEFISVVPMLIQPFVENSVKHGIGHKPDGGSITIHVKLITDDCLQIEIMDDGIGRIASSAINKQNYKGNGYSTEASRRRLASVSDEAGLEVMDLDDQSGTKVIITYPIFDVIDHA